MHGICCLVNVQVTHASTKLMTALIGVRREERTCAQDLRIKAKQYFIPSAYEASQHNLDSAAAVRTPRVPLPESRRLPSSDCPGEMLGGWNGAKGGKGDMGKRRRGNSEGGAIGERGSGERWKE